MILELSDLEVEFLTLAMAAALEQVRAAPYEEAVVVVPLMLSIAGKLAGKEVKK